MCVSRGSYSRQVHRFPCGVTCADATAAMRGPGALHTKRPPRGARVECSNGNPAALKAYMKQSRGPDRSQCAGPGPAAREIRFDPSLTGHHRAKGKCEIEPPSKGAGPIAILRMSHVLHRTLHIVHCTLYIVHCTMTTSQSDDTRTPHERSNS